MSLAILKVTPTSVRVRVITLDKPAGREVTIDRRVFGAIGAIRGKMDDGGSLTLGNFRTRDGAQMQPEYARLRSLLKKAA